MISKSVTLSEVCDLVSGFAFKSRDFGNYNSKVIKIADIVPPNVNMNNLNGVDLSKYDALKLDRYKVFAGDFVLAMTGATIGKIGRIRNGVAYINQRVLLFRPKDNIDKDFLYYIIQQVSFYNYILNFVDSDTAQPNISARTIGKYSFNLPEMETQLRIAKILKGIDDKIELNQRSNENLYEMVNTFYFSLFKNTLGEGSTIGQYAKKIYSGGTPTTSNIDYWNGTFGWFSSGETRNRFVIATEKTITQSGIDNSSTRLAQKYDIVIASAGQGFTRGQTSMLLLDTYVNQSVIVIHADKLILPYLFWNLANRYDELRAISDSSSIRGSLTTKMIASFEIPREDNDRLQQFSDFAWSIIHKIENNLLEKMRLTSLRNTLLPKLMSAEVDVPNV